MLLIQGISYQPKQKQTLTLPNGKIATMYLEFKPQQTGWFLGLDYEDFSLRNFRIVTGENIFRQFKNLLPFGLACITDDNQEPMFQEDIYSGRAKLYILTLSDVAEVEAYLSA